LLTDKEPGPKIKFSDLVANTNTNIEIIVVIFTNSGYYQKLTNAIVF